MTPCGFAKFSKEEDALRALKEKNGFNLRGSKLRVKAATEGSSKTKQTTNEVLLITWEFIRHYVVA